MIPDTAKDNALHAIGRTIANLQVMEHLVKSLSLCLPVAGHAIAIEAEMKTRRTRSESLTLGGALSLWRRVLDGSPAMTNPAADLFDPTMTVSIGFELEPDALQEHLQSIELLLKERNRLVHRDIVIIDWTADDEITAFKERIVDLNQRTCSQIEFLRGLVGGLQELNAATKAALKSEDFEKFLNQDAEESDA